ncbi:hypothetical protein F5B19DRAFT_504998 [Rostrohypoxylon terebratum]|nr:hypothetical protein F5B19DRAFT_504998 [Rostrohypoxylon terebratum]
MASKYPQYRPYGNSVEHLPPSGHTLAYDPTTGLKDFKSTSSKQSKEANRTLRRVPKDSKLSSSFGNWLGRHKTRKVDNSEQIRISEPVPIKQAPPRPRRPSDAPGYMSQLYELTGSAASRQEPKKIEIKRENLGQAHEALRSHPVNLAPRVDTTEKGVRVQNAPLKHIGKSGDLRSVVKTGAQSRRSSVERRRMADTKADRRKGRVFLNPQSLYEFPNPENFESAEEETDGRVWEDAGFDAPHTPATRKSPVPEITLTQPTPIDENTPLQSEEPQKLLGVDDCYKVLYHGQVKELRGLRHTLRYLVPLAWLVAEAEGVDLNDMGALENALKTIIADREKLFDLFPLAQLLAEDQKVDIDDFKALPRALNNVMADRDSAKRIADYHKIVSRRLEGKIAQLEKGKDGGEDEEEYQWM